MGIDSLYAAGGNVSTNDMDSSDFVVSLGRGNLPIIG